MAGRIVKGLKYTAACVLVLLAIVIALAWPLPYLIADAIVTRLFFPGRISWEGHMAWARCESAIEGRTSWPGSPGAACQAMHLCVNEAPLSERQMQALVEAIRATPGCPEP